MGVIIYRYFITVTISICLLSAVACQQHEQIIPGAERTELYFPLLDGKRIAICANQTSLIGRTHLVDSILSAGAGVASQLKVFCLEHGFRGDAAEGQIVADDVDPRTGVRVISLYGRNKKPSVEDMANLDLVIFDIQDVGVRFYTYISTLFYVMQACAENGIPLLVLDRPNPNGFYIDGPILKPGFTSFIGMHPVPVVYGMTSGEYAMMINGEGWLGDSPACDLTVIPCNGYDHMSKYRLPVPPSPNLPNMNAIYLYPSVAFFEGTVISEGRGTDYPFEVFGHPQLKNCTFTFIPEGIPGASTRPKLEGKTCYGVDLRDQQNYGTNRPQQMNLSWLLFAYENYPDKPHFFTDYFDLLAGDSLLRKQVILGLEEADIRRSWQEGLDEFKKIRKKYLLYPDFE